MPKDPTMATFYYHSLKQLEPRPGVKYATVYRKQTREEYQRTFDWFCSIAQQLTDLADHDATVAEWMIRPQADFPRSRRHDFYSAQDLITDIVNQMSLGKDLPEAMTDRWNRLCHGTPWQVDFVLAKPEQTAAQPERNQLFV